MNLTEAYKLIKHFEGYSDIAYVDPGTGGLPITIGYGSTFKMNGEPFKIGDVISFKDANTLLEWQIDKMANIVTGLVVPIVLNDNQLSALTSFAYNCGIGNLKASTLLKKVKANPFDESIRDEFKKWNKANKRIMTGLTRRRLSEADLYFT